jgi:hypothetical protein
LGAACAKTGSASFARQCGNEAVPGLCLPRCGASTDCASGQTCVEGSFIPTASAVSNNPSGNCVPPVLPMHKSHAAHGHEKLGLG